MLRASGRRNQEDNIERGHYCELQRDPARMVTVGRCWSIAPEPIPARNGKEDMSTNEVIPRESDNLRYEIALRINEALSLCHGPEDLASTLAREMERLLAFDQLYLVVLKENSSEIDFCFCGKGAVDLTEPTLADSKIRMAGGSQDSTFGLSSDGKQWQQEGSGSGVSIAMNTSHGLVGTLNILRDTQLPFSDEEKGFLTMVARVVGLALSDSLNFKRRQDAQASLQGQNERLQLLLSVTSRITSNLELREVLRATASSIREVMQCDAVAVALADEPSTTARLYALEFPGGKGLFREEDFLKMHGVAKQVLESLKPMVVDRFDPGIVPAHTYEKLAGEGIKSICMIPLANRGRALGLLTLARITQAAFLPDDIEFLSQAAGQIAIAVENALAFREISALKDKLAQEKLYLEDEIRSEMNFGSIVGSSPALMHVLTLVETVAPNDSTVLLLGETGTGKELIARAIHDRSRRKDRTLVKLNCAAIPTGLLESELFGHEKGAFTGAINQKAGRLELADQGTLFLDEVGDIPIEIQPKLLRALQEREFERLGSAHTRKVNVRLIAATNRDLERMVTDREFRSDLYYRLNVFPIRIPPLRERREDIPALASYFVQKFAKQMQKEIEGISSSVMKGLTEWEWPGNIRELENFIERAVILTPGKLLAAPLGELRRLSLENHSSAVHKPDHEDITRIVRETLSVINKKKIATGERAQKQREEIVRALTASKGRVGGADGAAARMGVNRGTLLSRIKKLGIDPKRYV